MPHRNTCSGLRQSDQDNTRRAATNQDQGDTTGLHRYHITMDHSHRLNDEGLPKLFHLRSDQTVYRMANRSALIPAGRLRQGSTIDLSHSDRMASLGQL